MAEAEVAPALTAEARSAEAEVAPAAGAAAVASAASQGRSAPRFEGLPEEAQGVLALFGTQLAQVSFPEVDAVVLEQRAEEVVEQRRAVEVARAALESATAELQRQTEELTSLSRRGLAYARIYAAAHPEREELAAALGRLEVRERGLKLAPKREDGAPAPRRGRPPKTARPELPFAVEAGAGEVGGDAAAGEAAAAGEVDELASSSAREPVIERDELEDEAGNADE